MSPSSAPAPWKAEFQSNISQMDSPEFVLSTLEEVPAASGSGSSLVPRARFCIFRGFWASLAPDERNPAPRNPEGVWESDLLTLTTDCRMEKIKGLLLSSGSASTKQDESGGGGPVEAVWWAAKAKVQWRVKGRAFVIGRDIDEENREGAGMVKREAGAGMRKLGDGEWSWTKELTAHFGNMSPGMRGTFANPPPGQPVNLPYDDKNLRLGRKVDDMNDSVARENFRVVVICPEEVEATDLNDPETARRQWYSLDKATGEWKHEECWP